MRRSARMRPNQQRAWDRHRAAYLIEVPRMETSTSVHPEAVQLDLAATFGRVAPLVVEIGPGGGESLLALARDRPEVDVLAFEVYRPSVARILAGLVRDGLSTVRVVEADAAAGLRHLLAPGSVAEVWTFFPDPWPKVRHRKRRLVDAEFATVVGSRLVPGGLWRLATDWADYAEQIRAVLDVTPGLERAFTDPWAPRWTERPLTRFEDRGRAAGRTVRDLTYRRVD